MKLQFSCHHALIRHRIFISFVYELIGVSFLGKYLCQGGKILGKWGNSVEKVWKKSTLWVGMKRGKQLRRKQVRLNTEDGIR